MADREHKVYRENSSFRKYSAEERTGNVKDIAEFSEVKDGHVEQSKFYTLHKNGEESLLREKGKSDRRGKWTVEVLKLDKGKEENKTREAPYADHDVDKLFSKFKGIKLGKVGGKRKSSKGPKRSKKKRSSKRSKKTSKKR